ncbi:zinc ribbon domain-containing protein [Alteribacillus sp. HJP-4]|uniref:zinc ribbon domain-containing protein n=1 Tax=Alteribacillus sp. HJP-4 TaxID=2775394 RepID=UPI0035CD110D
MCSHCGYQHKKVKDTAIRAWNCPTCGRHHHRDKNVAQNIKTEAEWILTAGTAELA